MSDQQNLQITVTVLAGVAVSCAALYWQSHGTRPQSKITHPSAVIESPATTPESSRPATLPTPAAIPKATAPIPQRKDDAIPTDNYTGADLPVVFAFSERTVYTTEEQADGEPVNVTKKIKEAIISNSSDQMLTITATEVNIPTQESSIAQIVLPAGTQKHFGLDEGLKMISGDQVTLRSPSYRNLVQLIP
jgi:hypothetical protein